MSQFAKVVPFVVERRYLLDENSFLKKTNSQKKKKLFNNARFDKVELKSNSIHIVFEYWFKVIDNFFCKVFVEKWFIPYV